MNLRSKSRLKAKICWLAENNHHKIIIIIFIKNIVSYKEKVFRFVPDFYYNYSIKYCYGMTSEVWTTMKKIRETA